MPAYFVLPALLLLTQSGASMRDVLLRTMITCMILEMQMHVRVHGAHAWDEGKLSVASCRASLAEM